MIAKSKPAVGYIRMSSDQQQDSPARQRKDVQALADRMGYEIIKWYEDHGQPRAFQSRPADRQTQTQIEQFVNSGSVPANGADLPG